MGKIIPFRPRQHKPQTTLEEYTVFTASDENGEIAVFLDSKKQIVDDKTKRHLIDLLLNTDIDEHQRNTFNLLVKNL